MLTPRSRKQTEKYADFFKDLTLSPINNDLGRRTDEDSIRESIKNLVMTSRGERLFQPDISCDVHKMLFENISADTIILIKETIRSTLEQYEPRANIISVEVNSNIDDNKVEVTIVYNIISREEPLRVNILLERTR